VVSFLHQHSECISLIPHICHVLPISLFNWSNNTICWAVQIVMLFITQFSPVSCYFLQLGPKRLPQTHHSSTPTARIKPMSCVTFCNMLTGYGQDLSDPRPSRRTTPLSAAHDCLLGVLDEVKAESLMSRPCPSVCPRLLSATKPFVGFSWKLFIKPKFREKRLSDKCW
jgi:hypothetical protein